MRAEGTPPVCSQRVVYKEREKKRPYWGGCNGSDLDARSGGEECEEECARTMRAVECPPIRSAMKGGKMRERCTIGKISTFFLKGEK
jgi:hypothetical protein